MKQPPRRLTAENADRIHNLYLAAGRLLSRGANYRMRWAACRTVNDEALLRRAQRCERAAERLTFRGYKLLLQSMTLRELFRTHDGKAAA